MNDINLIYLPKGHHIKLVLFCNKVAISNCFSLTKGLLYQSCFYFGKCYQIKFVLVGKEVTLSSLFYLE